MRTDVWFQWKHIVKIGCVKLWLFFLHFLVVLNIVTQRLAIAFFLHTQTHTHSDSANTFSNTQILHGFWSERKQKSKMFMISSLDDIQRLSNAPNCCHRLFLAFFFSSFFAFISHPNCVHLVFIVRQKADQRNLNCMGLYIKYTPIPNTILLFSVADIKPQTKTSLKFVSTKFSCTTFTWDDWLCINECAAISKQETSSSSFHFNEPWKKNVNK